MRASLFALVVVVAGAAVLGRPCPALAQGGTYTGTDPFDGETSSVSWCFNGTNYVWEWSSTSHQYNLVSPPGISGSITGATFLGDLTGFFTLSVGSGAVNVVAYFSDMMPQSGSSADWASTIVGGYSIPGGVSWTVGECSGSTGSTDTGDLEGPADTIATTVPSGSLDSLETVLHSEAGYGGDSSDHSALGLRTLLPTLDPFQTADSSSDSGALVGGTPPLIAWNYYPTTTILGVHPPYQVTADLSTDYTALSIPSFSVPSDTASVLSSLMTVFRKVGFVLCLWRFIVSVKKVLATTI